ncbi:cation diffusion facilitator family transporter [Denitromonas ohlonensis]|nr:cation diffusion facilitator family transporter [Denitromonas ohlonensis]
MTGEAKPTPMPIDDVQRSRQTQQVTLVAMATNLTLTVFQLIVGLFSNAFSLVADAMHTLSDLLTDGLVLLAARKGADPADANHPYGHDRIETVVSMFLGLVLVVVGCGFLWSAGVRIQGADALPPLHPVALWMALATLAAKEALFRYTLAASRRLDSRMLEANAWHARTDAASSLVVAIGIGGGLLGYRFVEPLAAALVGFMILRMGVMLAAAAIRELVDTAVSEEVVNKIRDTIAATPGARGVHDLRTRRMAHRILCDAHVLVDPRISVSEGHAIAEAVRLRVCRQHANVQDVLVHIDAEDDLDVPVIPVGPMPDRQTLAGWLPGLLGDDTPAPKRMLVHHLGGRVELELFFPLDWLSADGRVAQLNARLKAHLPTHPEIRAVRLHGLVAH